MARLSREELTHRTMLKNIGTLLETNPHFRRFLWTWIRDLGIFVPSTSRGSAIDTSFRDGRRAAGLEVIHMLREVRPDILGLLEREGSLLDIDTKPPTEDQDELLPLSDDLSDDDLQPG